MLSLNRIKIVSKSQVSKTKRATLIRMWIIFTSHIGFIQQDVCHRATPTHYVQYEMQTLTLNSNGFSLLVLPAKIKLNVQIFTRARVFQLTHKSLGETVTYMFPYVLLQTGFPMIRPACTFQRFPSKPGAGEHLNKMASISHL